MHYYQFNIKDYKAHTDHLSEMEDLAYRRMIDWCYLHERGLPSNIDEIARRILMRTHCECIANVLREFFVLVNGEYINRRVDADLVKYQEKSEKARDSAKARWDKKEKIKEKPCERNANASETHSDGNANHKPITINQEPLKTLSGKPDIAAQAIEYLNFISGSNYQPVDSNTKLIKSRIAEGRTLEDIKAVIDRKNQEWPPGHEMRQYLRPSTLFNATKFNSYFGQIGHKLPEKINGQTQSGGRKISHADNIREQARRALAEMDAADAKAGDGFILQDGDTVPKQIEQLPDNDW